MLGNADRTKAKRTFRFIPMNVQFILAGLHHMIAIQFINFTE